MDANPDSQQSNDSAGPSTTYDDDDEFNTDEDICRVCRIAGEGKLFHPCLCSGSIKYVHQECLIRWLQYSKKEVCELCNHRFSFKPIYAENTPPRLPVSQIATGVFLLLVKFLKSLAMHTFVGVCWLVIVPLIATRTHNIVFNGLFSSIFSSRFLALFSLDNAAIDIMRGWIIMSMFVCTFIALVWLREQVNVGGIAQAVPAPRENNRRVVPEGQQNEVEVIIGPQQEANNVENVIQNEAAADPLNEAGNEQMTWQRLLGLDGSFVFVENLFWVVSLNFVFHVVFLLFPSIVGSIFLSWINVGEQITYFKTPINIFVGYCLIVQMVYISYCIFKKLDYQPLANVSQITYLIIKVLILITTELIIFPVICGWWLDICSLSLTGSSLHARVKTFELYPISSTVLHWLAGMLYVFYSASLILSLRDLLRPGVLWFIRNLNDPDFSPVNEMIEQPIQKHLRRVVSSTTLFLSIIFLCVYCPLRIIKACTSSIIPYTLTSTDAQYGGFSLELMLLQVILPSTLEYVKAYSVLEYLVKRWCVFVGGFLKLDTYLLSKRDLENERPVQQQNVQQPNDLAGRHHALLVVRENLEAETYTRPDYFQLRLVALIGCLMITIVLTSLTVLVIPVSLGRLILICIGVGQHNIQDVYSVAIGFYACWLIIKLCMVAMEWIQKGPLYVSAAIKQAAWLLGRIVLAVIPILIVIPILLSVYFQLLVIGPLRVSIHQTPLIFPLKDWALGILHLKIASATIMLGPQFWLKTAIEQVYADGFRGIRLRMLYIDIVFPVVNFLTILIAAPYVAVRCVLFYLDLTPEQNVTIIRFSFPGLLCLILLALYLKWAYTKVCALYHHLRDERYLVGTQLVNLVRDN